jgi:hypothetical protein
MMMRGATGCRRRGRDATLALADLAGWPMGGCPRCANSVGSAAVSGGCSNIEHYGQSQDIFSSKRRFPDRPLSGILL